MLLNALRSYLHATYMRCISQRRFDWSFTLTPFLPCDTVLMCTVVSSPHTSSLSLSLSIVSLNFYTFFLISNLYFAFPSLFFNLLLIRCSFLSVFLCVRFFLYFITPFVFSSTDFLILPITPFLSIYTTFHSLSLSLSSFFFTSFHLSISVPPFSFHFMLLCSVAVTIPEVGIDRTVHKISSI